MRTEHDLTAVLQDLEHDVPRWEDVRPGSRSGRRPLLNWAAPVAVAAVLAVAVAAPVVLSRPSSSHRAPIGAASTAHSPRPNPSSSPTTTNQPVGNRALLGPGTARPGHLTLDFAVGPVPHCTFWNYSAGRFSETGLASCPGFTGAGGTITLYYKGIIADPTMKSSPIPGHAQYRYGTLDGRRYGVIWAYAPDSWATVLLPQGGPNYDIPDRSPASINAVVAIARTVRTTASRPFTVPFKFDLPGLYTNGVSYNAGVGGGIDFSNGAFVPEHIVTNDVWSIGYVFGPAGTNSTPPSIIEVAGRQWKIYDHNTLELDLPGFSMTFLSTEGVPVSDDQFRTIAAKITLAPDLKDTSTWFDAADAVPAS